MQIPDHVGFLVLHTGTFLSRASYTELTSSSSLRLLRPFYSQGLVDNQTFLTWLVQTMANCNLAQAAFVARLANEYLDGMLHSRALTKPFADACLGKLVEVSSQSAQTECQ